MRRAVVQATKLFRRTRPCKGLDVLERLQPSAFQVGVKSSKEDAANGKKSLWVKGREEFWQGAQLNVSKMLKAGRNYRFTVSAKLESGQQPAVLKMTMQRGDDRWDPIAAVNTTDAEWTTISGGFRPDGGDPYLLVFVESENPKTSYFLDDFKIEVSETPAN